jgi:hypothetical protein
VWPAVLARQQGDEEEEEEEEEEELNDVLSLPGLGALRDSWHLVAEHSNVQHAIISSSSSSSSPVWQGFNQSGAP